MQRGRRQDLFYSNSSHQQHRLLPSVSILVDADLNPHNCVQGWREEMGCNWPHLNLPNKICMCQDTFSRCLSCDLASPHCSAVLICCRDHNLAAHVNTRLQTKANHFQTHSSNQPPICSSTSLNSATMNSQTQALLGSPTTDLVLFQSTCGWMMVFCRILMNLVPAAFHKTWDPVTLTVEFQQTY